MIDLTDVEIMLGRVLTALEEPRAERLIEFAAARFEAAFPGFSLTAGSETVAIQPPRDFELWTPRYPVTAVDSLTADGTEVELINFDIKGQLMAPGNIIDATYTWQLNLPTWFGVEWEVTYDFGLDPLPLEIVEAIAGMVARVLRRHAANPDNVQSEMLGAYQVSYGDYAIKAADLGMAITLDQREGLKRWSRTRAVSVLLR